MLSCAYASCTMCLSSFHHDDYACILLCLLLSTYSASSSSSLRNFLTGNFLIEEFHKNRLFTPPLVDITHFQPPALTGQQSLDQLNALKPDPQRPGYFKGYNSKHAWTHKTCLWDMPYFKRPPLPTQHRRDAH